MREDKRVDDHPEDSGTTMDEYADLQESLPALNVRAGMVRAMGKRDTYLNLLCKFKSRFAYFSSSLQRCYAAGEMETAIIQVHSLKGIAASLGAGSLHNAAKELEQQLRRGHSPDALPRVEHLLIELMQQLQGLDYSVLEASTQTKHNAASDTPENALSWDRVLQELQIPLQKLQVSKVKSQLEQMRHRNWTESQREQLQHLEHMVRGYEYKQAVKYIEELL